MTATPIPFRSTAASSRLMSMAWMLLAVLLAFHFALCLQQVGRTYLDADAYTHFHEKRPYQYRVLMAPVMGVLIELFSSPAARAVLARLPTYLWTPDAAAYLAINVVAFSASCGLMVAIAREVFRETTHVRIAVALYIGMAYFFFCLNPNVAFILPYDVPSMAFAQACLLCYLKRRWGLLYPLFAVATVNRESVFLVIAFIAIDGLLQRSIRRIVVPVVVLSAIWLAVKVGLYVALSHLPTDEGTRIGYNVHALLKPWQWPALLPLMACFATTAWSLLRGRPAHPAWAVTGCLGFALIFVVGQVTETRAFADLLVFFTFAIAQWLVRDAVRHPVVGGIGPAAQADDVQSRSSEARS